MSGISLTSEKLIPLIIVVAILLVVFLFLNNSRCNNNTEGLIGKIKNYIREPFADTAANSSEEQSSDQSTEQSSGQNNINQTAETQESSEELEKKFDNRNKAGEEYKPINYTDGKRSVTTNEWEKYFDDLSNLTGNIDNHKNDGFQPNSEAPVNTQSTNKLYTKEGLDKPEDLFDIDKLLPKDKKDDWFEVMPEPISVKNRHLINITRPIGVNTIGTSLRNPSYDFRGAPPCPKFTTSPWLNSSIEPDTNIKPLA